MTDFDPARHRMIPAQRWFEDFVVGERFVLPSRTQTTAVFAAFQTASGDTHPVHYDVEYCRSRGMPHLLAHGFQTLIHTAPGAGLFPFMVEDSLVGFLEQSSRFLKPVFADDTIYPALEVTELVPGRSTGVVTLKSTVFNQQGAGAGGHAEIPDPAPASWLSKATNRRVSADLRVHPGCRAGPAGLPMAHEIPRRSKGLYPLRRRRKRLRGVPPRKIH